MLAIKKKGDYFLQDKEGEIKGSLLKDGFSTSKGTIETPEGNFKFTKAGIFSSVKINRNGREIGEVKSSWDGIRFTLDLHNRIHQYKLCRKNFLGSSFKLINEYKEVLVYVTPKFKWKKFGYDYSIEAGPKQDEEMSSFMSLLAVYGVRKLQERQHHAS